jgi:hypothetical protein
MGHTLRKWLAMASWVGLAWLSGCGGGGSDDPASPPPSPPPATVVPPVVDTARTSSAAIGPEGGTLRTAAANGVEYTLTVPPRALTETVTIRMTPITDFGNPALANGLTGAVQFEPSGLRFARLATLRIGTVGVLPAGSRRVGFSSATDGSRIQLSPPVERDGGIEILVPHFSNAGAADWTPEQLELAELDPDANPDSEGFWFDKMLAANGNVTALFLAHAGWFDAIVVPVLRATPTTDDSALEALLKYDQWRTSADEAGTVFGLTAEGSAQLRDLLAPLDARAKTALVEILRAAIDADLAVCQSSADLAKLSMASLFQQQAARLGLDTPERGLDRAAFLRKVNDCLRPVLDPAKLPDALSVGQPQSLDLRAQVVLNGQPNPVGMPFQFTVTPTGAAVATPVGFSDIAGRFTTVFTPSVDTPTFDVRGCLVLNDANGTTGSDICVSGQVTSAFVVLAGTIESSVDMPSDGLVSGERNVETTIGTIRIGVNAAGVVRVLQSQASLQASGVIITSACFDPALNRLVDKDLRFTSQSIGDWTGFFTSGATLTESAIGANDINVGNGGIGIGFSGLRVDTREEFVDGNNSCAIRNVTSAPRSAGGGGRVRVIERDAAGRITAVDVTETFTTRSGAVIFRSKGRLVAE